jgi:hypothetical protein
VVIRKRVSLTLVTDRSPPFCLAPRDRRGHDRRPAAAGHDLEPARNGQGAAMPPEIGLALARRLCGLPFDPDLEAWKESRQPLGSRQLSLSRTARPGCVRNATAASAQSESIRPRKGSPRVRRGASAVATRQRRDALAPFRPSQPAPPTRLRDRGSSAAPDPSWGSMPLRCGFKERLETALDHVRVPRRRRQYEAQARKTGQLPAAVAGSN